jgi:hypothetical protein
LKTFYRISDKGNPKEKLARADKFSCLQNVIREFGASNLYVIADNCVSETLAFIREQRLAYEETSLGNAASFRHMVELILATLDDDEAVYLLEDDYIHLEGAAELLREGLAIGNYVTLYDHPDKYRTVGEGGNPFNFRDLHATRLHVTKNSHWAEVNSTTMTFACRVHTLREDYPVWRKYTQGRIPRDFKAFLELSQNRPSDAFAFLLRNKKSHARTILKNWITRRPVRVIVSAIPARATHAETAWLAPVVDWEGA